MEIILPFLPSPADPNSVELNIDGTTDRCSKGEDINFVFTGFTLSGKVGLKTLRNWLCSLLVVLGGLHFLSSCVAL